MSADRRPSYEELAALVVGQVEQIAQLEAEVAELRRQLGLNSRNSSKPPSADSPFVKPAPKSLRRKSGRKPGGQPGHPGSTLEMVDDPKDRVRHEPGPCGGCGANLADAPEVGVERRQVFDLPPMTARVTEHQLIARRCECGATTCGAAPEGVTAPVQYGPMVTAIILYQRKSWLSSRAVGNVVDQGLAGHGRGCCVVEPVAGSWPGSGVVGRGHAGVAGRGCRSGRVEGCMVTRPAWWGLRRGSRVST